MPASLPAPGQNLALLQTWLISAFQRPVCVKAVDLSFGESFGLLPAMWSAEKAWMKKMLLFFPSEISLLVTTSVFPFLSRGNLGNLTSFPSSWSIARNAGWDIMTIKLRYEGLQSNYLSVTLSSAWGRGAVWNSPRIYYMDNSWKRQALQFFFGTGVYAYLPQLNQTFQWRMLCWKESTDLVGSFPVWWKGRLGLA